MTRSFLIALSVILNMAFVSAPVLAGTRYAGTPAGLTPPTVRQLVDIMLKSRDVPRSVDESCAHVGSQPTDRTLGDYVATLLTEYSQPGGRNWLTAGCKPSPPSDTSGAAWHCEVTFHRKNGEDEWSRGLFFRLTPGARVIADSYMCTGGN